VRHLQKINSGNGRARHAEAIVGWLVQRTLGKLGAIRSIFEKLVRLFQSVLTAGKDIGADR
jgi:hypothetical protein